jgi:predicted RNA binding protein YcfA (HicA-like mRNA interferase family)
MLGTPTGLEYTWVSCWDMCVATHAGDGVRSRGAAMKIRDIVKLIENDGWYLVTTRGSHRQYKHPAKPGRVTIAGHPNNDLAPGTLNSVFKQAQLQRREKGEQEI